ncbi:hypothetical protein CEXT_732041 [Caerostris extrusa]|uniref:Uncharacterized protein n=1 Tax=Caerostris extrusa TaxID=172846 RepID=A0AAV4T388_CAEEX|nr:hypothetical protein CEXT_732041 [Caerostris extrusa]
MNNLTGTLRESPLRTLETRTSPPAEGEGAQVPRKGKQGVASHWRCRIDRNAGPLASSCRPHVTRPPCRCFLSAPGG